MTVKKFYEEILTTCPKCQSQEVEALQFDTDVEGVNPVAYLPYQCEKCGAKWTIELRPVRVHFK